MKPRSTALATAAGIAVVLSPPAAAQEPLVLEPSSRWEVDYAEDSCALRRMFGEGERQTQLEMRRYQPGADLQTTVASKAKMTRQAIRIRFGNEPEWEEQYPLFAKFGDELEGVIFDRSLQNVPPGRNFEREGWTGQHLEAAAALESETAARVDRLTLSGAFEHDLVLKTGPLKGPVEALNKCIDNLLTHWDLDLEAHKTRSRSAGPINQGERPIVLPPMRRQSDLWGPARIRLAIDEAGKVTQCRIQLPPTDPPFEESGCKQIREEVVFQPALDSDGRPMNSYYVTGIGQMIRAREVRIQTSRPKD